MTEKSNAPGRALPGWRSMHMDTAPWAEQIQMKFYREAPAWRKLKMCEELTSGMLRLAEAGLEARHPQASQGEIRRRMADTLLGPELAARVYGPLVPSNDAAQ